jgi:hypothetical protein
MYPKVFEEMQRQKLSGLQLIKRTNLKYQTTFSKLKRGYGGKITLEEAIQIRKALGVDMDLEELFREVS